MADNANREGRRRGRRTAAPPTEEPPTNVRLDIASLGPSHRANNYAQAEDITSTAHERMLRDWPVQCPRFIQGLQDIGFHLIRFLGMILFDPQLFTALLERWSPLTNTFHLAVGEMTVTLQDVQMILGIRVDGPPLVGHTVVGEGLRWDSWEDCCDELLGSHPDRNVVYHDPRYPDVPASFNMGKARTNAQVPLRWLRIQFCLDSYAALPFPTFLQHVRAYVLYLIGCFLLPDTSGSHVYLIYLPLLEDPMLFSQYSIGSAVLGFLYRELTMATRPTRTYIGGCLHLLQVWSWERLCVGRPIENRPTNVDLIGMPVGFRWSKHRVRQLPGRNTAVYRDLLDDLRPGQVCWTPYSDDVMLQVPPICTEAMELWTARVPLVSWRRVEWHLPDRVMRQFGSIQSTDVLPIEHGFKRKDGRGNADTDWMHEYAAYIALWNDRRRFITEIILPEGNGNREYKIYLMWYKTWASLYLIQPQQEPPTTYYPRAPDQRVATDYIAYMENQLRPYNYPPQEDPTEKDLLLANLSEVTNRVAHQLHIDSDTYGNTSQRFHSYGGVYGSDAPRRSVAGSSRRASRSGSQRSDTDSRRHSTYAGPSHYEEGGPSSRPATQASPIDWMVALGLDTDEQDILVEQSAPPTTQQQEQQEEQEEEVQRLRRTRRSTNRYTPEDAIRRRRRA